MTEINLLNKYPKSNRKLDERQNLATKEHKLRAQKFDIEYFDGDRFSGYGGYNYNPKFWKDTIKVFIDFYKLKQDSKVLDLGCAKGFMIYDFKQALPNAESLGIDISDYAIKNCKTEIKDFIKKGNANSIPFEDNYFDLVISINTIHNLDLENCKKAIQEISRVTKKHSFLTVDAWRNDKEKKNLMKWNLTAKTYMHTNEWKALFSNLNYKGDYWWFIAE